MDICTLCGKHCSVTIGGRCSACAFLTAKKSSMPMCASCGAKTATVGNPLCLACATLTICVACTQRPAGLGSGGLFCTLCAAAAATLHATPSGVFRSQPPPPAPPIPGWIAACFVEIPAATRPQAAGILGSFFPDLVLTLARAAESPEVLPAKLAEGTYLVVALRPGSGVMVPGLGSRVNGKLTAAEAEIMRSQCNAVVAPHVWDDTPWVDPARYLAYKKPPAPAPAPLAQTTAVDWMRALFSRTPMPERKRLYRSFTKVVHVDVSGDMDLYRRWIATYERYAPN